MVARFSTNQVRHRLTSLIEANALTTTPDHHSPHADRKLRPIVNFVPMAVLFCIIDCQMVVCRVVPGENADSGSE